MENLLNYPIAVSVVAFVVMWAAAYAGTRLSRFRIAPTELEEFNLILGATLTLLGLIIGFAFSMAVGRYDQRKNYEEEEANAIGTEYVRADLLPAAEAGKVHDLLKQYLQQRILYYEAHNRDSLEAINSRTAQLQNEMWSAVATAGRADPTQVTALAVSGMNDVLNRQGYTQAAWWNRIPVAAWAFMGAMAICSNLLVGLAAVQVKARDVLVVLPIVLAIALMLLADLDSPRGGIIRVKPQNLLSLADSIR